MAQAWEPEPAVLCAKAGVQPEQGSAAVAEQLCSQGGAAEAAVADGQQAGLLSQPQQAQQPDLRHQPSPKPGVQADADAVDLAALPADLPAAAVSPADGGDTVINLLSDDSDDGEDAGWSPEGGRSGASGALSAAAASDAIIITESELQQDEGAAHLEPEESLADVPHAVASPCSGWVPRCSQHSMSTHGCSLPMCKCSVGQ